MSRVALVKVTEGGTEEGVHRGVTVELPWAWFASRPLPSRVKAEMMEEGSEWRIVLTGGRA